MLWRLDAQLNLSCMKTASGRLIITLLSFVLHYGEARSE